MVSTEASDAVALRPSEQRIICDALRAFIRTNPAPERQDAIDVLNKVAPDMSHPLSDCIRDEKGSGDALDLLTAAKGAEYALTALIEDTFVFDDDDGPDAVCVVEVLCGEAACNAGGCIKDKRDALRAAIAKATGQ